jgi:CRP-like cAMP-binding protein
MDDRLALFSKSSLFEMLSNQELQLLSHLAHERDCAPGEVIVQEGQLGDSLFIIAEGDVEVSRTSPGVGEQLLARMGPLDVFGEMGLIEKESRSATVKAKGAAKLLWLSVEDLTAFRAAFPNGYTLLVINLARLLAKRLRATTDQLAQVLRTR